MTSMRAPRAWDDRDILRDEPFLTRFAVREAALSERRTRADKDIPWNNDIGQEILQTPGGPQAIQAWVDILIARTRNPLSKPRRKKTRHTLGSDTAELFVEAFWLLHQNKPKDAVLFLTNQLKVRGYEYHDFTEGDFKPSVTAVSPNPDSPPSDARRRRKKRRKAAVTVKEEDITIPEVLQSPLDEVRKSLSPATADRESFLADYCDPQVLPADHYASEALSVVEDPPAALPEDIPMPLLQSEEPFLPQEIPDIPFKDELFVLDELVPPEDVRPSDRKDADMLYHDSSSTAETDEHVAAQQLLALMSHQPAGPFPTISGDSDPNPIRVLTPLPRLPPVWAQSRQEVCESFDWFRSYQSGVYHSRGVVKGYLLSAFASRRDTFEHDGKLIISHGGGKAESLHSKQGLTRTALADDQLAQDKSVRALLHNYRSRIPLVLLVDDKYALFPYDLGLSDVAYAVLGFYTIVHAWAESQPAQNDRGHVVRYKFAFQWCDSQGEPWWLSEPYQEADSPILSGGHMSTERPIPVKAEVIKLSGLRPVEPNDIYQKCVICKKSIPRVYRQGWMCLNPDCSIFWTLQGHSPPEILQYDDGFLRLQPASSAYVEGRHLFPSPPVGHQIPDITTNYAFSRGWHCSKCGRLSTRFKWQHWECAFCLSVRPIPRGRLRSARDFWTQFSPVSFYHHHFTEQSGIKQLPQKVFTLGDTNGLVQTLVLPHNRGRLHHIRSGTPLGNLEADEIFREYQEQAADGSLVFRRWPLRTHKLRGPLLTNYFSQNTGIPYQYVGGTDNTVPWERAPNAVIRARKLIQDRIRVALPDISASFNEVLSCAYMERQRMAFHSDAEEGLGPLVAGLSLGSSALMHFRLTLKHEPARERTGIHLSFLLRHGDVLVMDGAQVQEYYEHTVVPMNFRIAATARSIRS